MWSTDQKKYLKNYIKCITKTGFNDFVGKMK